MENTGEQKSMTVGQETLTYQLKRTGRRKTVGIFVEPDGQVSVLAPSSAAESRVEQILRRRIQWIRRQQRTVEALPPPTPPRHWVAGETHKYLGRQYRLRLDSGSDESVKLIGRYFVVTTPDIKDRDRIRYLMESWYRDHATRLLADRVRKAIDSTTWLDVDMPPITIRELQQRWGSTTKAGRITFNIDLVKLPLSCIDYVVVHELVHLKIPNHSPAFWRMLSRIMPDWRRWRDRLWAVEV